MSEENVLGLSNANHLEKLYNTWFLDYASYVILDRAVPYFEDGLKPVQRRILHTMFTTNDGKLHKVAGIVGDTMHYHPHGDASIYEALVNLGQKNLLIDTQGNWGNPLTGDEAAAPRYIEARLTSFALEVLFNPETTHFIPNYNNEKKEPVTLPAKFPLLLAQGVDGIAVGLSTTILPHNFCELCEASIAYLRGKKFTLYPDFFTGGSIDVSEYNDGARGGRLKVRAKIEKLDNKTIVIRDVPFGKSTDSIRESIVAASEKGKIKIKRVDDHTAKDVEIIVHLYPGSEPQKIIDALYAFTDCQISLAANSCVIVDKKPHFLTTTEILKLSTDHTVHLLEWELKNKLSHLEDKWHFTSLEKIFIENEIYEVLKKANSQESMITLIRDALKPFFKKLRREVSDEDILKLTEIPFKRISRFNRDQADKLLVELDEKMLEVKNDLEHLTDYAINHFKNLLKKYGEGRERKTTITEFDAVDTRHVALVNQKLFVNRKEGFIGTGMKKEEYLFDVSEYDDLIVFKNDGSYKIVRVEDKTFVGKDILLVEKFNKADERRIYNVIYRDGKDGTTFIKRFNVGGVTRDKDYTLGKGTPGSKVLYLSSNPNGEAEVVEVILKPRPRIKLNFEVDFSEIEVKGRGTIGNIVTKYAVKNVKRLRKGVSTLGARLLYFDAPSGIVSMQRKGDYIGEFGEKDKVLVLRKNGTARLYDIADPILVGTGILRVLKYDPEQIFTVLYYDGLQMNYIVKRFKLENCPAASDFSFISEHPESELNEVFTGSEAKVRMEYQVGREVQKEELDLTEIADVQTYRARGSKFTAKKVKRIVRLTEEEQVSEEETPKFASKNPYEVDLFD